MRKTSQRKEAEAAKLAAEFREFCQSLIREKIKTKADREAVAKALGLTPAAIVALVYKGVGSFETFLGTLFFLYKFDLKTLKNHIYEIKDNMRHVKPVRESDKAWYDLDSKLSEEEKTYWVQLIRAATDINVTLAERSKK